MMTKISILFVALICWSVPSQAVVVHSVCPSGCDYPDPSTAEAALPSIVPTWPVLNDTYIFEWQAGQSFQTTIGLPYINNGQIYLACKEAQGSANLSCPQITDPVSSVTVTAGMPVSGPGVSSGATVSSVSGSGPYTVTLSSAPTPPSPQCTLSPGSETCTQTVTLYFGSANWIVHRSNQCYTLPPGTRAGPVNTTTGTGVYSGMAKLITPTHSPAVAENSPGASYHRFECLEMATDSTAGDEPYYIVALFYQAAGAPGADEHQISDLAHHVVFDRDYIHHFVDNNQNSTMSTTIGADAAYLEITNSTVMVLHPNTESHAFGSNTLRGPLYFRNNEFESTQIGTLIGGSTPAVGGVKSTGAQFLGNYYYRPWLWRVTSGTALPTNTFYPSTCMYDSSGGESYFDATNGHWYLCASGTWADQGTGTPPQAYCQTPGCTTGGSTNLVCTTTASSTTLTCNDTTGVQVGMLALGPPALLNGGNNSVAAVVNSTTITLTYPALSSSTGSVSFYSSSLGGAAPYCYSGCSITKNQWECKNCFGTVIDGNWFQNDWQPTLLGQGGDCVLLNQVGYNGTGPDADPSAVESYSTFTNNRCDSNSTGFIIGSVGGPYNWVNRGLKIDNNLYTNIGLPQITGGQDTGITGAAMLLALGNVIDTSFDHNTMLLNNSIAGYLGEGAWYCNTGSTYFISWTNSIINAGTGVWYGGCPNGYYGSTFNPYALYYQAPTSNFSGDIIITNQSPCYPNGDSGNCGEYQFATAPAVPNPPMNLCNGCQFPTSLSSVFQSYPTNLAVSSIYQGTGYLGTDPGADIPVVNWSTQGAVSGAPNPYLDFRVRSLLVSGTTAMYYYTAPDTGACALSVANNSGYNPAVYSSSDSGGNPDRSVMVTGLSPNTRYWYRLVCGASNYRRSDVFITTGL